MKVQIQQKEKSLYRDVSQEPNQALQQPLGGAPRTTEPPVEVPPTDDAEFLRSAAVEIEGYAKGASARLKLISRTLNDQANRTKNLRSACALIHEHLVRLQAQLAAAVELQSSVTKAGSRADGSSKRLVHVVAELQSRHDRFNARLNVLRSIVE